MITVKNTIFSILFSVVLFGVPNLWAFQDYDEQEAKDNRIRKYVFNENEVFLLTLSSGFNTRIEFATCEKIQDVILGDMYSWKAKHYSKNRLFLSVLEDNVRTNMTVITNKRIYEFDLVSVDQKSLDMDPDLNNPVYVVKFSYPKNKR